MDGFVHAIRAAIDDETHGPAALVIAWGQPEDSWERDARSKLKRALKAAAEQHITVVAAAGDLGAGDGLKDEKGHVDFPPSSTWVLAAALD